MKKNIFLKIRKCQEYMEDIEDLIISEPVQKMAEFKQHGNTSCLHHCMLVSYYSYKICRFFSLDAKSAARAGLLHDLFLYDWHTNKSVAHSYMHPRIALYNAKKYFELNNIECDMIEKHMYPLTYIRPAYYETVVIALVDKYCAIIETCRRKRPAAV